MLTLLTLTADTQVEAAPLPVDCAVSGAFPADRSHCAYLSDDHVID